MSWQRLLEFARQHKLPVIVTDPAAREPMVIIPLEEYEKMAERENDPVQPPLTRVVDSPKEVTIQEIVLEEKPIENETPRMGELSLEEKFYLEPIDGEEN